jgi:hypothetical protein
MVHCCKRASMSSFTLTLDPVLHLTEQQFFELCQLNRELKFERSTQGELIIMPPTGGETGWRNNSLSAERNPHLSCPTGGRRRSTGLCDQLARNSVLVFVTLAR